MGELERIRLRTELQRLDLADTTSPSTDPRSQAGAPARDFGTGRLSPEERRALREQLRQNPVPSEPRRSRRAH